MASEALEVGVQQAEEAVTKQGDNVRSLKALLKEGKGQKVQSCLRRKYYCSNSQAYIPSSWHSINFIPLRFHDIPTKPLGLLHLEVASKDSTCRADLNSNLQADVDAAIARLKDLKLDLEAKQKVLYCAMLLSCTFHSPSLTMYSLEADSYFHVCRLIKQQLAAPPKPAKSNSELLW